MMIISRGSGRLWIRKSVLVTLLQASVYLTLLPNCLAQVTTDTPTYKRIKKKLDAVRAIDTHDHLFPFDRLPGFRETAEGRGMNVAGIWGNSYWQQVGTLTAWKPRMKFDAWWKDAHDDWDDSRATSFYRYTQIALQDLYGVDWDRVTAPEAVELDRRIFANYQDETWLQDVITKRANIELMFNDPYWGRYSFETTYPFEVLVFNITPLVRGFHASEFDNPLDSPYEFARRHGMAIDSLDDLLKVIDRLFLEARDKGAVCLKSTLAYQRTLRFEDVPKSRAEVAFGKRRTVLSEKEIKDFEDFIFWRICQLSARYELPFQIHTGHGRLQGSNPMLLVDMIEANPKTKFILFHGGYPWTGETGAILLRHWRHVWIDSVWLPQLSYSMAKRAYHEWLEQMPSTRIMWGGDCNHAEGIYGSTELTRRCLAEVLAEKVDRGDLREADADRIGHQILRQNALDLFPQLKTRLTAARQNAPRTVSGSGR